MESKRIHRLWAISLLVIGIVTIIGAGCNVMGIQLPDIAVRILGVIDLIALPVLAFWGKNVETEGVKSSYAAFLGRIL